MPTATKLVPISFGMVQAFLILGDRPVLVDTGIPGVGGRIEQALAQEGLAPADLSLIVLTHAHSDHAGSAVDLRQRSGAPVAVGAGDAADLEGGVNAHLVPYGAMGRVMGRLAGAQSHFAPLAADVRVEDSLDLTPYGVAGRVLAVPGHTPGSLAVHLADGRVVAGDLLLGSALWRDRPRLPYFVDDLAALRASTRRVLDLAPTILYPAHGRPCSAASVARRLGRA